MSYRLAQPGPTPGGRLVAAYDAAGLTKERLAALTGLWFRHITLLERDKIKQPRPTTVAAILRILPELRPWP
jgi:transcriptional regulator with XRE-family HTH domain